MMMTLAENGFPEFASRHEELIGGTLIGAGIVLIVLIRTGACVIKAGSRERTRREIAAYIAEGSLTAEQGERLLNAGKHTT